MKDKILGVISEKDKDLSLKDIAEFFDISEDEVKSYIEVLKTEGIDFHISDEQKYTIMNSKTSKSISKLNKNLKDKNLDYKFFYFPEVGSTNNIAKMMAETGAKEGTIILADKQVEGKARSGKAWESPKGGLWLSIVLKPKTYPSKAPIMTLATGVAVAQTLLDYNLDAGIKWPNDIFIKDKKVCGILTEANTTFNVLDYIIVGVGLDSNVETDELQDKVDKKITSMKKELDKEISNTEFLGKFIENFDHVYKLFQEQKYIDILNEWRKLTNTIGRKVEIIQPFGRRYYGEAVGINNRGMLIIEKDNGDLRTIFSGECILKD